MTDQLTNLLDSVRTMTAVERGEINPDSFNKSHSVSGHGATGSLVVPWQLTDYGLSIAQATEVWEASWSDPKALALWAAYMESIRVQHNIPLPEPTRPERIITEHDLPPAQSLSFAARLKSLAGRRMLKRS